MSASLILFTRSYSPSRLTGTPTKYVGRLNARTAGEAIERQGNDDGWVRAALPA